MPAATDSMKLNMAMALGTPRDIMMGSTITPMAITGPAPVMAVKMTAVTMLSSATVTIGRSPPSSTVLRMRVEAMPVSIRTRPNQAPQQTLTNVVPQPSGADW